MQDSIELRLDRLGRDMPALVSPEMVSNMRKLSREQKVCFIERPA
ncbi:hypothetical protein [uncultured Parasphingorhabdus sp.]|tara:strand:+ start:6327 stop:6461 length:135 start_codon:yes stop_codon:yes gene_type:complete